MNVYRLQSREGNERIMEPIRLPEVPVLHGPLDPAYRQAANADQRRNFCTEACGFSGCSRLGASGGRDSQAGEGADGGGAMSLYERDCKDFVAKEKS